jgi:dipeptidyl-peptidase-4
MRHTRRSLPLSVLLVVAAAAPAADPPKDTPLDTSYLKRHAETRGFMLGRPVKPKFTPDGKAVLFLRSQARVPKLSLFEFDVATGKTKELLTPAALLKGAEEHLSPEEKARRERMRVSVGGFTDYHLRDDGRLVLVPLGGKLYTYERLKGASKELKTGKGTLLDPKFSPDGKKVSYVLDYDVYVYDLASDKETRVTTGGTEKKPHGLAEFVAQEEMNRFTGYWWSPDSKSIAYQETDHDGVEVWYVDDPAKPERKPELQFYPRPGKKNAKVRLGIIPLTGGKTVWVKWDHKKYEYMGRVSWTKFGLVLLLQPRLQDEFTYCLVDQKAGEAGSDFNRAFVVGSYCLTLPEGFPRAVEDGKWILYLIPRDENLTVGKTLQAGTYRIQLAQPRGKGGWRYTFSTGLDKLIALDEKGKAVYVLAETDPTQMHLFRVPFLAEGKPTQLSKTPGVHDAVFAKNFSAYVLTSTGNTQMPRSTVHKIDGTLIGELPSIAEEPPFKPNVTVEKVGDGDGFYTAVVRPRNFDPKKKYPVLVYVYGGPTHQLVTAQMRNWLIPQWLADQGFVVVSIDNRGTPGRGDKWQRAVYQKFGSVPLEDQVAGLKALGKKHPEMDLGRVGIYGWSFGGYLSAQAVLKRPDVFKAAIAGAPVTDWEDYDTHYTERYLGLLPESKKAYQDASLLPLAPKLERPLLLIHGTADDNVYFRHTLRLADALFRAGKDFELLPLPGLTHMVPDPVVNQRLYGRFARFFQKNLGKAK